MKILAVDTALGACSVAILDGDAVLAHRFVVMERGHAEALAPMVQASMDDAGCEFSSLDRLAVTTGPGTFTGQRVGLAFMRALRIALDRDLVGVTTLSAMAHQALAEMGGSTGVALHDARRGEVYLEIVGAVAVAPSLLSFEDAVAQISGLGEGAVLAGTAAARAKERLLQPVLSGVRQPDALWVAKLAWTLPVSESPPRPLYLRPPDAKLPVRVTPSLVEDERDLARLAQIHAESFATPWTAAALDSLLKTPGTFAFQIDDAFIVVRATAGEAEILTLAVRPEHRRGGKGASLVRAAAGRAQRLGASCLFLEVAQSDAAARGLYDGLGFVEVGRRKAYYASAQGKFEDALILRSNLPLSPLGNRPTSG